MAFFPNQFAGVRAQLHVRGASNVPADSRTTDRSPTPSGARTREPRSAGGEAWRRQARLVATVLLAAACSAAPAEERVIHGFEHTRGLKASGKVTLVHGADVVTEGTSALQLAPGSSVRLTVAANVIDQVGWLRIDTFEVQPVLASLQITVGGASRQGHVQPGKDTLAFPLGLAAGTERGAWPKKPMPLEIRNAGRASVVVDNLRAAPPARPPPGSVLLDFGPAYTAVWPGFEPAGPEGTDIAWSGQGRIYALSSRYPDPLLGDFAGLYPSHMTRETLTITPAGGASTAWAWLTHYGSQFSPALEYMAGLNNRMMLHHRLSPMQMLSAEGLLAGKGQPWTTQWLEESLVPRIVSKVELPLKAGVNLLQLANCQVSALVMAPRRAAGDAYLRPQARAGPETLPPAIRSSQPTPRSLRRSAHGSRVQGGGHGVSAAS